MSDAEKCLRMGDAKCLKYYGHLIKLFEEKLCDYETSSYFHEKCWEFSIDHKNKTGEIEAYKGLGVCEDKVLNTKNAMKYLEIALNKAVEANLAWSIENVSNVLINVYEKIAEEY